MKLVFGSRTNLTVSFVCLIGLLVSSFAFSDVVEDKEMVSFSVSEGSNFSIALSPDGRKIASDLQGHIWLLPAKGGEMAQLTAVGSEARFPSWSPSSDRLAFQRYVDGQWHIWVMDADGTSERQLTFGAYDDREPVWSSDGKRILFGSDRAGSYDLWQVELAQGLVSPLTQEKSEDYYPAASPDGKSIAFVSSTDEGKKLEVLDDAGARRSLLKTANDIYFPSWSPDAKQLAYLVVDETNRLVLQVADLATDEIRTVSASGEDIFNSRPAWYSNTEVLYTADGVIKHRTLDSESSEKNIPFKARLSVQPASYERKDYKLTSRESRRALGIMTPTVSPNGRQIAFVALGDLWLLDVGNSKPVQLTNDRYMEIEPAWSPDGSSLVYASDRRGSGTMDLYLRDMKTGKERQLTETDENLSMPVFSPDGKKIAVYMTDVNDWHAKYPHVLDLKSGKLEKVYGFLNKPSIPSWSPNGEQLAIVYRAPSSKRYRKGWNRILFVPLDGSPPRVDSPTPTKSLGIRAKNGAIWAPDGHAMTFIQDGVLWVVPVNSAGEFIGNPRRLTNILADHASWTGDSKSIVFQSADSLKRIRLDDGLIEDIPLDLTWSPNFGQGRKVVQASRLFDSKGDRYRKDVDIVIDDNIITDIVSRRNDWGKDVELIDARDRTVIPGLIESHVHNFSINGETTGRIAISYGVTSVREPGADPHEGVEAREAWASGRRLGPRLFTTGLLEGNRVTYGMSLPISNPAYLELELDRAKRLDYDFIKTYERLDEPLFKRVIEFAHSIGIPVASHELYPAAAFGADTVEHIGSTDRLSFSDRLSPTGHIYQDVIDLLRYSKMQLSPTTVGWSPVVGAAFLDAQGKSLLDVRQYNRMVPKRYLEGRWLNMAINKNFANIASENEGEASSVAELAEAGVLVPVGTDTSFFNVGFGIITEMQYYVKGGMSRADALRSATIEAAKTIGVGELLGTIEKGKLADLVIVDGDPLSNLFDLVNVDIVIKDGNAYPIEQLFAGQL